MLSFKEFIHSDSINEWNATGYSPKDVNKWIKKNGFTEISHNKHPKYQHDKTGESITGSNHHGKEMSPQDLRGMRQRVIDHHTKHKLPYTDLN